MTLTTLTTLSYSSIQDWLTCRQRYFYRYHDDWEPVQLAAPLLIGSATHAELEHRLLGALPGSGTAIWADAARDAVNSVTALPATAAGPGERDGQDEEFYLAGEGLDEEERIGQVALLAELLASRALAWLDMEQWETLWISDVPAVELPFRCEIPGWSGFTGRVDWVSRHLPTGRTWITEFKVRGRLTAASSEAADLQKIIYQHCLAEAYGVETTGVQTIEILNKLPAQPRRNRDGSMSRVRIATDWETYRAALLECGLQPSDYEEEMRPKLDVAFFQRREVYRSMDEARRVWEDVVVPIAADMISSTRYRNLSPFSCSNCAYRRPCLGELRGYDSESMLRSGFRRRSIK